MSAVSHNRNERAFAKLTRENKELRAEVEAARNLLARIHGDGGHHYDEHGLESYKEAERAVMECKSALWELTDLANQVMIKNYE